MGEIFINYLCANFNKSIEWVNMKKLIAMVAAVLLACSAQISFATQDEYCDGFSEGYKSIKGNGVFVPSCPFAPFTPFGTTDFRQGFLAGIKAAQK